MTRIVQITDSHVTRAGTLWKDQVDNAARLARVVEGVNALAPDLVIHTGDLVELGLGPDGAEEYALAAEVLAGLTAPLCLLPGNHDGRAAMRAAFPDQRWESGPFLQQEVRIAGLTCLGLDSVIEGETAGALCENRLDWLRARLTEPPTLIFMHHPPCPMGLPFMDGFPFTGGEALKEVIAGHPVLQINCGHVHADVTRIFGTTRVSSAEAVTAQIPTTLAAFADHPKGTPRYGVLGEIRLRYFDWDGTALSVKTLCLTEEAEAIRL
ncbi:phosphodiesterase [Thalassococcus sp. S3]|uniref:phosphodiesterase n=1 Tax=Thalassococcus sp. S3 TaxID=2017482 RepID=UPI0013EED4CE|nr:phosphodiesterase [Thalassococcus sp. S3]